MDKAIPEVDDSFGDDVHFGIVSDDEQTANLGPVQVRSRLRTNGRDPLRWLGVDLGISAAILGFKHVKDGGEPWT